jgi:hypothetical protein
MVLSKVELVLFEIFFLSLLRSIFPLRAPPVATLAAGTTEALL